MATTTRLGTLALAASVLAALLACKKGGGDCPARYEELSPEQKAAAEVECGCAAGAQGTVWGTGVYTTDSNLCAAAAHAGAIPAGGGKVKIVRAAGCQAYNGSTANGITTGGWGPYSQSFYFAGHGDGKCAAPAATPTPAAQAPKPGECPRNFASIPGASDTTEFSCDCSGAGSGSVWGSGIYTRDSDLCKAGVHAGAIPASGGKITVKAAPGCAKYNGSTANGVATGGWGSYQGSFYFPSKNDGKCQ